MYKYYQYYIVQMLNLYKIGLFLHIRNPYTNEVARVERSDSSIDDLQASGEIYKSANALNAAGAIAAEINV